MALINATKKNETENKALENGFVPALKFVYPQTKQKTNDSQLGMFIYNGTIINNDFLTVTLCDYRGWVYAKSKSGIEEQTFVPSSAPSMWSSPKADLIRQGAPIKGLELQEGTDVLCYIHELDKFATIQFTQADMNTFNMIADMEGSITLNRKTIKGKTTTYYRLDPVETGEDGYDFENHPLYVGVKQSYEKIN